MGGSGRRTFPFAKTIVVLAIAFVVGLGLCGLDIVLMDHGFRDSSQEFGGGPLDGLSLIVMTLSAVGLVLALMAWVVTAAVRAWRKTGEPETLIGKKDEDQKKQ